MDKTVLRSRVQANRDQHRDVYERAMKGYRKAAVAFFEEQLDKAVRGELFETYFREPMPEDHTEDYDVVLDMLAMDVRAEVPLSQAEFRQYVRDDWGWKRDFLTTAANYMGEA
jgi:hypothetical protein